MIDDDSAEMLLSLASGGVIALLSFALAAWWDERRYNRDRDARRTAALTAFAAEVAANRRELGSKMTTLAHEQRERETREIKALVNPIAPLETGAWPIARVDLPGALLDDEDLVRRLALVHRVTVDVNALIASRETFRITYLGDEGLLDQGLPGYGEIILHQLRDLNERSDEALRELVDYIPAVPG